MYDVIYSECHKYLTSLVTVSQAGRDNDERLVFCGN